MADFVKKKIVEKLAKFTKDLKPSDISLAVLTGKGVLTNLELNCDFISQALQLPPWIQVARVVCDRIRAHVPFTNLRNDPIFISIGTVEIEVTTATGETAARASSTLMDKLGSNNASKYGFTEKVIDGMKVEVRSIVVNFRDPAYQARLEISDILIQSTNPEWTPATLAHTRYKTTDEESIIIYKMCNIGNVKLEGWIVERGGGGGGGGGGGEGGGGGGGGEGGGGGGGGEGGEEGKGEEGGKREGGGGSGGGEEGGKREGGGEEIKNEDSKVKLRLIAGETNIRIALKRRIDDCSVLHSRIVVRLGDIMWILSQSQLQAVSKLVQTLMTAAIFSSQRQREERDSLLGDDSTSLSGESMISEDGVLSTVTPGDRQTKKKSSSPKVSKKKSEKKAMTAATRGLTQKEREMKQKMYEYRSGKTNMPAYEVIQNSVHILSGTIDLQFCDDNLPTAAGEDEEKEEEEEERDDNAGTQSPKSTVESSLLVRLKDLQVDIYLDQPAGSGRHHWNKANDLILRNVQWSEELIKKASKTQHMDLPSVSLQYLQERGVVIRCADFAIESLCNAASSSRATQLPLITSDKKTFNIPNDIHNPAFQMGLTLYFYNNEYSHKFLVPRPNLYVHLTPIHATLHQDSLVWIIEFIYAVLSTVNLDLAMSVHSEGKAFLEERKSQSLPTHQLPGIDLDFKILFTKVTVPLPHQYSDGRPRALQLETASINIQNHSLDNLLQDGDFKSALEGLDKGWVFATQDTGKFPHFPGDFPSVPPWLREMLNYKLRTSKFLGLVADAPASSPLTRSTSPVVVQNSELMYTEAWHIHTACVHLSFTKSDKHEDTLRPRDFVDDFPLHLWLFLPREKRVEEMMGTRRISNFVRSTSSSTNPSVALPSSSSDGTAPRASSSQFQSVASGNSPSVATATTTKGDEKPMISFLAHVPSPIRAELERLQFLFLLRLKDSFNQLKSSAMKFLSLKPPDKREPSPDVISSPLATVTQQPQSLGNRHDTLTGDEDDLRGGQSSGDYKPVSNRFSEEPSEVMEGEREEKKEASIGGCIVVRDLQADILLPSILVENTPPTRMTEATPTDTPLVSPTSFEQFPNNMARSTSPTKSPSPCPPSPLTQSVLSPPPLPPTLTTTGQTSFKQVDIPPLHIPQRTLSETRLINPLIGQSHLRTGQAGSQISLPVMPSSSPSSQSWEGERSGSYHGDSRHSEEAMEEGDFVVVHSFGSRSELGQEVGLELGREEGAPSADPRPEEVEEKEEEKRGRERLASGESQEMTDTLTPLTETPGSSSRKPFPLHRAATTSSLRSTTSSTTTTTTTKRGKPPIVLRTEPQHLLRVKVRGLSILPNIQSNEISIRSSVSCVQLAEILATDKHSNGDDDNNRRRGDADEELWKEDPVIRARIEIGSQVERFNLPPASETGKEQDVIAMLSIHGLHAALLAKNAAVVKDFFEDEFEADAPVSIQLHLEDSTFELREEIGHTPDNDATMNVKIKSIDVHRGKQVTGTNLFPLLSNPEEVNNEDLLLTAGLEEEETLHLNSGQLARIRDTSPAVRSTDSSMSSPSNSDLLETFRSFVRVFESHVRRHGGLKVQLTEPEHIAGLLQELQVSLSDQETEPDNNTQEAPPTYSETLKRDRSSTIGSHDNTNPLPSPSSTPPQRQRKQSLGSPTVRSRASELRKLRQDSLELSKMLSENEELISQLTQAKVLLAEQSQDLDQVTSECKKAKDELVTHKQVLENYQEHIERLLAENADLRGYISGEQH